MLYCNPEFRSWILAFVLWIFVIPWTDASHFRGGIITWRPLSQPVQQGTLPMIEVSYRMAWRRSFSSSHFCDASSIASGEELTGEGSLGCTCGGLSRSLTYICTDFSVDEDWTTGINSFQYEPDIPSFVIFFNGAAWIPLRNGGGSWDIGASVDLSVRTDTGRINSSPTTTTMPIVRLQRECSNIITIPVTDADGDDVRCIWARDGTGRCGGICTPLPRAVLDSEACEITWDVDASVTSGLYGVAIEILDYPRGSDESLSSIPLQFLVDLFSRNGSCVTRPVFIEPTRAAGSCIGVPANSTYHEPIVVRAGFPGLSITNIETVSPQGVFYSAIMPYPGGFETDYFINATWTPQTIGVQELLCFTPVDSAGSVGDQRCIRLVTGTTPPQVMASSLQPPNGSTVVPGPLLMQLQFDQNIVRPTRSTYINVFENTGRLVFRVDARSREQVEYIDGDIITFIIPEAILIERVSYYILLDPGVVTTETFCGIESSSLTDDNFWRFSVNVRQGVTITCPSPIEEVIIGSGRSVTWAQPQCNINGTLDSSLVAECEPASGSLFEGVSSTLVTCTCVDAQGNQDSCSFPVTVTPGATNNPPSIDGCPSDQLIEVEPERPCVVVSYIEPTCVDNEDRVNALCSAPTSQVVIPGTYIVTCTCEDSGFLVAMCSFTIQVNLLPPFFVPVCPENIYRRTQASSAVIFWDEPEVFEAFQVTRTHRPGDIFQCGTSMVSYTYRNNDGRTASCFFIVTVIREQCSTPTLNPFPSMISISTNDSIGATVPFDEPTGTFDCGTGFVQSATHEGGDMFPLGNTSVTYNLSDTCQNTLVHTFTVLVEQGDNSAPSFTNCPTSTIVITSTNPGESSAAVVYPIPSCFDGEDGPITPQCIPASGSVFVLGETDVRCTCEDSGQSLDTCSFRIDVIAPNRVPVFQSGCPDTVIAHTGSNFASVGYSAPLCSDPEDGEIVTSCSPNNGTSFGLGETFVNCQCVDSGGLSVTCIFEVSVRRVVVVNPQTIQDCPSSMTITAEGGDPFTLVAYNTPACMNPNGGGFALPAECTPPSEDKFGAGLTSVNCFCSFGVNPVTGLPDSCTFDITILTAPQFVRGCPELTVVRTLPEETSAVASWPMPTCDDAADGSIVATCTPLSGTVFDLGPTSVTCTCTDSHQLSTSCTFDVQLDGVCFPGWTFFNQRCLLLVSGSNLPGTRESRRAHCLSRRADLAKLDPPMDFEIFVRDSSTATASSEIFIGLEFDEPQNGFRWVRDGMVPTVFQWLPGQPDRGQEEDCVAWTMTSQQNGWSDTNCDRQLPFICERSAENPVCGSRNETPLTRIVGGQPSGPGRWPWQGSLGTARDQDCGATLITEEWAVTAAHCIGSTEVFFGDVTQSPADSTRQVSRVSWFLHPQYNPATRAYDIALLNLHDPVEFNDFVSPACLYTSDRAGIVTDSSPPELGDLDECYITGWGAPNALLQVSPNSLQEARVDILPPESCAGYGDRFDPRIMICAGDQNSQRGICQGDDGGPLICRHSDGGLWNLVGVISFGEGCATPGFPGVFTRVVTTRGFIEMTQRATDDIFKCGSGGSPVLPAQVCNNIVDCPDRSDEMSCPEEVTGRVRTLNSPKYDQATNSIIRDWMYFAAPDRRLVISFSLNSLVPPHGNVTVSISPGTDPQVIPAVDPVNQPPFNVTGLVGQPITVAMRKTSIGGIAGFQSTITDSP